MIQALLLALLLIPAQSQSFTSFHYCKKNSTGAFESLCIQLGPNGAGEVWFKQRDGNDGDIRFRLALSASGKDQFLNVLSGTKYLANAKDYESKRKVADLGMKHLTLEMPSGRREAEFNYSELKDVNALVTFFESLLTQEALLVDLQWATQFDPLGIPDRLDRLEKLMKAGRITDTGNFALMLDAIERDERIVNYARSHARELKAKISSAK